MTAPNPWRPDRPAPTELPPPPRLALSVAEAAEAVGVSARMLWQELTAGRLKSARVGRRRIVRVVDLEEWLAARVG